MKEKIAALRAGFEAARRAIPREIWGFCGVMIGIVVLSVSITYRALQPHAAAEPEAVSHVASPEGSDGASVIAASPFPDEILDARDGKPEPDHDLVEPEVEESRGLASVLTQDLSVSTGRRFVTLDEVMGASSATKGVLAHIFIELALEVRDRETQLKVEARKTELKSLVASQVSEYSKDQLKTSEGQMQLKADVMTEINHLIQGGVEDVLFSKFTVK
jgi:hypothetical protein